MQGTDRAVPQRQAAGSRKVRVQVTVELDGFESDDDHVQVLDVECAVPGRDGSGRGATGAAAQTPVVFYEQHAGPAVPPEPGPDSVMWCSGCGVFAHRIGTLSRSWYVSGALSPISWQDMVEEEPECGPWQLAWHPDDSKV